MIKETIDKKNLQRLHNWEDINCIYVGDSLRGLGVYAQDVDGYILAIEYERITCPDIHHLLFKYLGEVTYNEINNNFVKCCNGKVFINDHNASGYVFDMYTKDKIIVRFKNGTTFDMSVDKKDFLKEKQSIEKQIENITVIGLNV